ncbi:hypothetical protein JTB14_020239 [Gonioctena quinquepunctata]|nr:hypothetical protein JTB14_020239 [Gonioctena quinquepunctata]
MPRKSVQVNRKKGKSAIITDTPEKDDLMKAYEEKAKKRKTNKGSEKAKVLAKRTKKNIKSPKVPRNGYDSDTGISSEISLHDKSPKPANLEEFYEKWCKRIKMIRFVQSVKVNIKTVKKSGSSVNFARNGLTTLVELWESYIFFSHNYLLNTLLYCNQYIMKTL